MSSAAPLFIITILLSVCIGALLVYFSGLSGKAKFAAERERRYVPGGSDQAASAAPVAEESIKQILESEMSKIAASSGAGRDSVNIASSGVAAEIAKKVTANIKTMSDRYEKIIEEKGKSEEVAWKKYSSVVSEKEKTEAVIRSVAEGLVVVDDKGQVVMMNPAAEKLLGVSRKDKVGRPILEGARKEQLFSMATDAYGGKPKEIELVSQADETKRVLRASSAIIENENGQTVGMVSVLNDITKQKELDEMKASFVANVSHELRTPLVAVEKSLTLILGGMVGNVSASQEELLSIAHRNIKRLSLLINDLLDLSKLEAAKMKLEKQSADIAKVIRETIESLDTWAKSKSIKLEARVPADIPQVEMDPNRVIQVLVNLIGNAIKFTPKDGKITVSAAKSGDGNFIEVSVKDNGIGIAKEDLPKIFEKFYQAGDRVSKDIGGTGIGLAVSKDFVELHGGKIWAESEKGQGVTVIFTLPLAHAVSI